MTAPDAAAPDDEIAALDERLQSLRPGTSEWAAAQHRYTMLMTARAVRDHNRIDRDRAITAGHAYLDAPTEDADQRAVVHALLGMLYLFRALPAELVQLLSDVPGGPASGNFPSQQAIFRAVTSIGANAEAMSNEETASVLRTAVRHLTAAADAAPASPSLAGAQGTLTMQLGFARMMLSFVEPVADEPGPPHPTPAGLGVAADLVANGLKQVAHDELQPPGLETVRGLSAVIGAIEARSTGDEAARRRASDDLAEALLDLEPGHVLRALILDEEGILTTGAATSEGDPVGKLREATGKFTESLEAGGPTSPLYAETLRRLASATLSVTAAAPSPDALRAVLTIVDSVRALPQEAGASREAAANRAHDHYFSAQARLLEALIEGKPAEYGGAVAEMKQAVALLPLGDPMAATIVGTLAAALIDRHSLYGSLEDASTAAELMGRAEDVLRDAAPGATEEELVTVRLLRGYCRALLGARKQDEGMLRMSSVELEECLAALSPVSPWRSRAAVALAIARLARGSLAHDVDLIRAGARMLREVAEADTPFEAANAPMLVALRGGAAMLEGVLALGEHTDGFTEGIGYLTEALRQQTPLQGQRGRLLTALAFGHLGRFAARHSADDLEAAIEVLEEAREIGAADDGQPGAAGVLWNLATSYRVRDDRTRGDRAAAITTGLAALRASGNDVLLQSGAEHGLVAARAAGFQALGVAQWALTDDTPDAIDVAIAAVEAGRGLVLTAATTAAAVPDVLRAAGEDTLAAEWSAAAARGADAPLPSIRDPREPIPVDPFALTYWEPPSQVRTRVLATLRASNRLSEPPTVTEIAGVVSAAGADALCYLIPGSGDETGWLLVIPARGAPVRRRLPQLVTGPGTPPHAYAEAFARLNALEEPSAAERDAWRTSLGRLCDWAHDVVMGELLALAAGWELGREPRLVLVATETLAYVPWAAARSRATGGELRYACQDAVLSTAVSARQLGLTAGRVTTEPAEAPVLLGNPDGSLLYTDPLVAGMREALYRKAVRYPSADASAECRPLSAALLRHLPGGDRPASSLHLGCHAVSGPDLDRSYLTLSASTASGDADRLSVLQIVRQAEFRPAGTTTPTGFEVVLQTCVADVTTHDPDEGLTLASGFGAAGATSVIGAKWRVQERPTALLMFAYHHYRVARRQSSADALRAAQLWMLDPQRRSLPGTPIMLTRLIDQVARRAGEAEWALDAIDAWGAFVHQGELRLRPAEGETA